MLCRVVQRKDLTSSEGAQCAEEISTIAQKLLTETAPRGFIFDIRSGPPVFGPKTEASLRAMFDHAMKSRVSIRCVVSDNPLQEMQYGRLLRETAPRRHEVCRTFVIARDTLLVASKVEEPPPEA